MWYQHSTPLAFYFTCRSAPLGCGFVCANVDLRILRVLTQFRPLLRIFWFLIFFNSFSTSFPVGHCSSCSCSVTLLQLWFLCVRCVCNERPLMKFFVRYLQLFEVRIPFGVHCFLSPRTYLLCCRCYSFLFPKVFWPSNRFFYYFVIVSALISSCMHPLTSCFPLFCLASLQLSSNQSIILLFLMALLPNTSSAISYTLCFISFHISSTVVMFFAWFSLFFFMRFVFFS